MYKETYDPNYGKEHKEWEQAAWNAAIDEAVKVVEFTPEYCPSFEEIADKLKELKE